MQQGHGWSPGRLSPAGLLQRLRDVRMMKMTTAMAAQEGGIEADLSGTSLVVAPPVGAGSRSAKGAEAAGQGSQATTRGKGEQTADAFFAELSTPVLQPLLPVPGHKQRRPCRNK
uniref:Uncharacterized protein n=1 Tax=Oryza glaberrima TaxID=4538 RepID=I1PD84_ORYGL